MQTNYHFLRPLSQRLEPILVGKELTVCFSQEKDELILGFCDAQSDFWIKAVLTSDVVGLQFLEDFRRAKKNSVDLLPQLIGLKIDSIRQFLNERCFSLTFEQDYVLLFKLFGNQSNIVLFQQGKVISIFKKKITKDLALTLDQLDRPLIQDVESFEANGLQHTFPTLGKEVRQHLASLGFEEQSPIQQWQSIQLLLQEMAQGTYYLSMDSQQKPILTLFEPAEPTFTTQDPLQASNEWYYRTTRVYHFVRQKQQIEAYLKKRIRQSENYIANNEEKLAILTAGQGHRLMADLLMAHLDQVPPKAKEVELPDFYQQDSLVKIKLNSDLSPQKNAENYYRKAKNQQIEIDTLQRNTSQKEQEIYALLAQEEALKSIQDIKEIREFAKKLGLDQPKQEATNLPYKAFNYQGFEIWVGKNAKANDILTQKYAWKEDLWLHVREAAGSHVVIKHQAGRPFPNSVIEKAASLAVHYSTVKSESLYPVIYTPKKYVRKPKGSPPGAVIVDKESVLIVPPLAFDEAG